MQLYRSFSTTVSQMKIFYFSGEAFKSFEVLIIFYGCSDHTTALQRRVFQTAL